MKYSTAHRKSLTVALSRRLPLQRVAEAFQLNAAYQDRVVKVMIKS